jgi:hypothetical protein
MHDPLKGDVHGRSCLDETLEEPEGSGQNWLKMLGNESTHVHDFGNRTSSRRVDGRRLAPLDQPSIEQCH